MIHTDNKTAPEACPVLPSDDRKTAPRDGAAISTDGATTTIDVRGMEPPRPLIDVLGVIDGPDVADTVIVRHDRDPLLLYPELEERGWTWSRLPAPSGELRLRLTRNAVVEG